MEIIDYNDKWDKMEDDFLNDPNNEQWIADYSDGYDEVITGNVTFRNNKYWINQKTTERITNKEFEKRQSLKYKRTNKKPIESFKFDILDFGK